MTTTIEPITNTKGSKAVCVGCGTRITYDNDCHKRNPQIRWRSSAHGLTDYCVQCAAPQVQMRRSTAMFQAGWNRGLRPIAPRYCTCTGLVHRTPGLREQCADCLRRIDPTFDAVGGDTLTMPDSAPPPPPRWTVINGKTSEAGIARTHEIIVMRMQGATFNDIAKVWGISKSRVGQILAAAERRREREA